MGEIRDKETAEIAMQFAQTGHLVFSTLHTNNAPETVTRLLYMGVDPYLMSVIIRGVLAQRLVRKICPNCKEEYEPKDTIRKDYNLNGPLFRGKGCDNCRNTGYKGRIGIFELMIVDNKIRYLILEKAPTENIRGAAINNGMRTLYQEGLEIVRKGVTTIEEVARVVEKD